MKTGRLIIGLAMTAGIALASGPMSGCSTKWDAVTTFQFGELPKERAYVMRRVFTDHGLASELDAEESVTTFRVSGITTTGKLASVLKDVNAVSKQENISQPLERATLTFGSLSAGGRVYTTIEVNVSIGARAFVADRQFNDPWREVEVTGGKFKGMVNTSMAVQSTGGWVYICALRDGARRYSRVNVLSGELQNDVSLPAGFPEPSPSLLRQLENIRVPNPFS